MMGDNMTIIILEGNECNYKTTVANKLSERLGWPVLKGSSFEMSTCTQEELYQKFLNFTEMNDVIIDRFIWSNLVYAPLYKDFSMISLEQAKDIQRRLLNKAYLVVLHSDVETLTSRLNERGDEYVKVDRLQEINNKYWEVLHDTLLISEGNSEFKKLAGDMFDTKYFTSDEIVDSIVNKAEI